MLLGNKKLRLYVWTRGHIYLAALGCLALQVSIYSRFNYFDYLTSLNCGSEL